MAHRSQRGNSITFTVLLLQLTIEGADKNWALSKKRKCLKNRVIKKRLKLKVDPKIF